MASCKPAQIITLHDIQYRDHFTHDTLTTVQRDSIRITQKGDTVFYQSFKTLYKDRIVIQKDSVLKYVDKPVTVEKIIEVPAKLNWFQNLMIHTGIYIWIAFILLIVYIVIRNKTNIIKILRNLNAK
jgi:hypothetical protein